MKENVKDKCEGKVSRFEAFIDRKDVETKNAAAVAATAASKNAAVAASAAPKNAAVAASAAPKNSAAAAAPSAAAAVTSTST